MHAAVVELDALPDAVGPGAQDQHLGLLGLRRDLGLCGGVEFVAAVVVRRLGLELGGTGVDGLVHRVDAEPGPQRPHTDLTGQFRSQGGYLTVGQAVVLAAPQKVFIEHRRVEYFGAQRDESGDLVDEPRIDARGLRHLLDGGAFPQRQFHVVQPPVGGRPQPAEQVVDGDVGVGFGPKPGPTGLQRPHHLAERLDEVAAQRHRLAHGFHGRGQGGVGAGELLEREAGRLHDDIVQGRLEARRRFLGDVVDDLIEGVADRQFGGDLRDRETGGLGRQRTRPRHPGVHLDDDETAVDRIDGELDVASAGVDTDLAQNVDAEVTHCLVFAIREGHRGRHGDRVAGVHAHRIEVLDRAHDDHVVVAVAHQLELEFLPTVDGLLYQHVGARRCGQPFTGHPVHVLGGIRHARAQAAHGERRPHDHRQSELGDGLADLVHCETHTGARGFAADLGDDVLEPLPILAALDRVEVGTDHLDAVALQRPVLVQRDSRVQRGLPAQGGQHRVDLVAALGLLGDDALDEGRSDRFDVGEVGVLRVGHDRRRVRVDEAHLQALCAEHAAGLRPRVVELARLADDDRPGADHQDVVEVGAPWHLAASPLPSGRRTGRTGSSRRAGRLRPRGGTAPRRPSHQPV